MKTIPVIFASLFVWLPAPQAAATPEASFQQRCEREMKPNLLVRSRQYGYRVNNTVSSRVLNNRSVHHYAGELMLGMTALQTRAEVSIDAPSLQDELNGRECIAPQIMVELSFPPLQVYVAREFSPASCSYRQILEHEMLHVQLYREQLPKIEVLIRAELERRFGGRPLYAAAGKGIDQLEEYVDSWLRPLIKTELAKIEVFQAALDAPEEAFRMSNACHGELALNLSSRY